MTQRLTSKDKIAELLFNETTAAFPSSVIQEILQRIADERVSEITTYKPYVHDERSIFIACGLEEDEVKLFTEQISEFIGRDEIERLSEGVEFIENSNASRRMLAFLVINLVVKKKNSGEDELEKIAKLMGLMSKFEEFKKRMEGNDE